MSGFLVVLNGWPGVGKSTVGEMISRQLGARLLPNHLLCAPASALSDVGSTVWRSLRDRTLDMIWEHIASFGSAGRFIVTSVVTDEVDRVDGWMRAAREARIPLLWVTLDCDLAENLARLTAVGRSERGSLVEQTVLKELRHGAALIVPSKEMQHLKLDVTHTQPSDVARIVASAISEHLATSR